MASFPRPLCRAMPDPEPRAAQRLRCLSRSAVSDGSPPGSSVHGDSPGKDTGVGRHALLQGIFPVWESNPGFLDCRWILYHLRHQGSPCLISAVFFFATCRPCAFRESHCTPESQLSLGSVVGMVAARQPNFIWSSCSVT